MQLRLARPIVAEQLCVFSENFSPSNSPIAPLRLGRLSRSVRRQPRKRPAAIGFQIGIILPTSLDSVCRISRYVAAMDQSLAGSVVERRTKAREHRLWGARIVFNNNSSSIDCTIRDLSAQGARLCVASSVGVPDWFDLRIDRNRKTYPSRVAWRSHDQIGVVFLDSSDNSAVTARNLPQPRV